jgi:hypothetical protein
MDERLTGKGVLSSGDKQWNVDYDFVITTSVVRKPGFRQCKAAAHRSALYRRPLARLFPKATTSSGRTTSISG